MFASYDRSVGRGILWSCSKYSYLNGKMQHASSVTHRRVVGLVSCGTEVCLLAGSFGASQLAAHLAKVSISGTVVDPTGAVVPNAEVTAGNSATGAVLAAGATAGRLLILRNSKVAIGNYGDQEEA